MTLLSLKKGNHIIAFQEFVKKRK